MGRQTPTFHNVPTFDPSYGDVAAQLAAQFTQEPMEWQKFALGVMLARDPATDRYQFPAVGISVPRQNGKSEIVRARVFYGMIASGERVLYTCQHGDTADEMFKQLAAPFEDENNEELAELLKTVRRANGQQAIYLNNGGYVRFTTRTNSMSRGRSYDVLIYDEAQELTDGQQAASLPAISASHLHNPQTIYLGTPPTPDDAGGVFQRLHDLAHVGNDAKAPAWMEWAAPEIGDPADRERWYECNPSLGILIDEAAVEAELVMAPDVFARERLGWWSSTVAAAAIPAEDWKKTGITADQIPTDGKKAFGVKFAPDGHAVALAVCLLPKDGPAHVELVDVHTLTEGIGWASNFLTKQQTVKTTAAIALDGKNGRGALANDLRKRYPRLAVIETTTNNMIDAVAMLMNGLATGEVTHWADEAQAELDYSARVAVKRAVGSDGGWAFGGDDSTAIEAAALALWAARTTRRNPTRGSMIL